MPTTATDAQLVTEHLSGDRAAFAAIYDRYGTTLYDTTARLSFVAKGTSAAVDLDATIARPPTIRSTEPPASICSFNPAGPPNPLVASATVIDESPRLRATFEATNPAGTTTQTSLFERGGVWRGSVATDLDGDGTPDDGLWSWVIEAADRFGNTARATGETVIVPTFC